MPSKTITFDVRYTESGRLVPVDDPLMLRIVQELDIEQRTVSDLSQVIDSPASTLYLTMNKMVASGLISKGPMEGKRNARFMSSSMSIMKSCTASEMPSFDWMVQNSHSETDSFLAMFSMFHRMGLDMNPIMRSYGRRLALTPKAQEMYSKLTSEEMVRYFGRYLTDNNLGNAELESFIPFKVNITPNPLMADMYRPVTYMIVGFLKQMFIGITGRDIAVASAELHSTDDGERWEILFEFGNGSTRNLDVYQIRPEADDERFIIVKPREEGTIRLLTNPTDVRLMLAVNDRPIRMYDVSKTIGVTKSTASMYVNKMIREGLLTSDNIAGTVYIRSLYTVILHRNHSVAGRVEDLMDRLGKISDFKSMVHNMMRFFSGALKFLGFDTHYIMEELGSAVAESRFAAFADEDPLELLNRFMTRMSEQGSETKVISLVPLSISYMVPDNSMVRENMAYYHNGYLKRMLTLIGGTEVTSVYEIIEGAGFRRVVYTFTDGTDVTGGV